MSSDAPSLQQTDKAQAWWLGLVLVAFTGIPVLIAVVRVIQIPLGGLPEDSLRLMSVPVSYFLHSLAGTLFGVLGPLQLVRSLRQRYGKWHRRSGYAFVFAGMCLGVSGLVMLLRVQSMATGVLDVARGVFGLMLLVALARGVVAARARYLPVHRAWMIRAYAIGMGSGTGAPLLFPLYVITGQPPTGLFSDGLVVGMWLVCLALSEWVIRRRARPGNAPGPVHTDSLRSA